MNCSKEALLDELTDFSNQKPAEIPSVLDEYLSHIAKTGDTLFPWHKLKPLLCRKLELVMNEFHKISPTDDLPALPNVEVFKYEDMKEKVLEAVNSFNSAPFTIQRLCELVVDPRKHYKRTDKFMRGVEKNVLVVSTIEPRSLAPLQQSNAASVPMVNGIPGVEDGGINGHFADTTDDSLSRQDGENGHCEDEGICADDPGTNVEVPSSATDASSLGEAPQPVSEEVVEEQQEAEPSGSTERLEAESSKQVEEEQEADASTVTEHAEVEKEAEEPTEEAVPPEAPAEEPAEAPAEAPAENVESSAPSVEDEPAKHAEEHTEEAASEESPCDKDDVEAVAATTSESDSALISATDVEAPPVASSEEPPQSALDLSEADAMPVDASSDLKAADNPPEGGDGPLEADFSGCDSSISDMPGGDEELKEPPLKKFHPEPEACTEAEGADQQEEPSSTSAPMEDSPEEEPMDSSKVDAPVSADDPAEAMDTTADSSVEKDAPLSGEQQTASPDESPMEQN
uniref:Putative serine/threonine protein phosphatase 4 regulatory subunit n=1 Tax=Amblyomma sculptum TaxID=1581419 RepID=A0A1E1XUY1_AMBSC